MGLRKHQIFARGFGNPSLEDFALSSSDSSFSQKMSRLVLPGRQLYGGRH
jgi:hypothetical protein